MRTPTAAAVAAAIILAGCGSSYDEQGFEQVQQWSSEAVSAAQVGALTASAYVDGDADGAELEERAAAAEDVLQAAEDLPDREEVASWGINMSQGDPDDPVREWSIEGDELAEAVDEMESALEWFVDDAYAVLDGHDDEEFLVESAVSAWDVSEELSAVLTGE